MKNRKKIKKKRKKKRKFNKNKFYFIFNFLFFFYFFFPVIRKCVWQNKTFSHKCRHTKSCWLGSSIYQGPKAYNTAQCFIYLSFFFFGCYIYLSKLDKICQFFHCQYFLYADWNFINFISNQMRQTSTSSNNMS